MFRFWGWVSPFRADTHEAWLPKGPRSVECLGFFRLTCKARFTDSDSAMRLRIAERASFDVSGGQFADSVALRRGFDKLVRIFSGSRVVLLGVKTWPSRSTANLQNKFHDNSGVDVAAGVT